MQQNHQDGGGGAGGAPATAQLSSKLGLVSPLGFALRQSREADYSFHWHTHDCAMLLWPQLGSLKTAWLDPAEDRPAAARTVRLAPRGAILLAPHTAHQTHALTARQHHLELYLAPELLRGSGCHGAIQLDGACVAMLEALAAPSLAPASAAQLVRALLAQLAAAKPLALPLEQASLPQKMVQRFMAALRQDRPLPAVATVAAELGVSLRQLQRACQHELGASPVAVRRQLLATQARRLLAQQGQSLARVSEQLGFATSGHLTRLMRSLPG